MGECLPIFIDEVPEYKARGGVMFVRWRGLEIAIPISTCQQCLILCEAEIARWHLAEAEVLQFAQH